MGDEVQWAWDPLLEFQPNLAPLHVPASSGKGTEKGKLPVPPSLPAVGTPAQMSQGSTPTHPPASAVRADAGMDVDEGDVISSSAIVGVESLFEAAFAAYKWALINIENKLMTISDLCSSIPHIATAWLSAWETLKANADTTPNQQKALAMKKLVWKQTQTALEGQELHSESITLQVPGEPIVYLCSNHYTEGAPPEEKFLRVENMDCLEAARILQTQNFSKVAVLLMASSPEPGGDVKRGGDSQEEDIYRRTDMALHTHRYSDQGNYPIGGDLPVVMRHDGVTIFRGPTADGFPFLTARTAPVTILSVAADRSIEKKNVDGKLVYASVSDKDELQQSIRLLLHAIIESNCTAVVLSALGCGCDGHPPEEVALLFKREIYRVGSKMPYVYFAIQNKDANITGNFEIFRKILTNAENEVTWLSGMDVWNNHVLAQARQDFPQETLGDAGGPGSSLYSRPDTDLCCTVKLVPSPREVRPVDRAALLLRALRTSPR